MKIMNKAGPASLDHPRHNLPPARLLSIKHHTLLPSTCQLHPNPSKQVSTHPNPLHLAQQPLPWHLVESLNKVTVEHIKASALIKPSGQSLQILQHTGDSGLPWEESILACPEQLVGDHVGNQGIHQNTFHHLANHTGKTDWSVVSRIALGALLEKWAT